MSTGSRRAVGYIRVSKSRIEQSSLDTQRLAIEGYCSAMPGVTLVDVVVDDGRSAFKENRASRPGFRRARAMIEAGAADTLIVWKFDRASRSTLDLLTLLNDLGDLGAGFVSVTEQLDTSTPMGRVMLTVIAALAEMESAQKSERASTWHAYRDAAGAVPVGRTAKGYFRPERGVLEIDPVEGPLIATAAHRVLDGASLRSTVTWLGAQGVTISQTGLAKSFRSATIAGHVETDEGLVEGDWEPLISVDEWRQLVALLGDPARRSNFANGKRRYALAGIVACACGGAMRTKQHPRGQRWLCVECGNGIRQAEVEELVTADVLARLDDATWAAMRKQGRGRTVDATAIEAKLAELWQMVLDGELEIDEYRAAKLRWQGELAAVHSAPLDLPDVASVRAAWDDLTVDQRRLVFVAVVESLTIAPSSSGGRGVDVARIVLDLA